MNYRYKCGSKIIRVFVWDDDFPKYVVVESGKRNYARSIRKDRNGKFFTWNKNKVYLKDWIRTSMKDFKEKIERGEHVTSDDLCQAILSDGLDKVRFIVPLSVVSGFFLDTSKYKNTLCKIEERWNRRVSQNFQIIVVPVIPEPTIAASSYFYVMDFLELIQSGVIQIVV